LMPLLFQRVSSRLSDRVPFLASGVEHMLASWRLEWYPVSSDSAGEKGKGVFKARFSGSPRPRHAFLFLEGQFRIAYSSHGVVLSIVVVVMMVFCVLVLLLAALVEL